MAEEAGILAAEPRGGEVDFMLSLAAVLLRQNRLSQALKLAEACSVVAENDRNVLKFLCYARLQNGDHRGCLAVANKLNGDSVKISGPPFYLLCGKAFFASGQMAEATRSIEEYRRLLTTTPDIEESRIPRNFRPDAA